MTDINQTPDTGTPEGVAQAQVNTLLQNPAQVPQKFKGADGTVNVDALMASYLELEKSKSAAPADTSAADAATLAAKSGLDAAAALANSSEPTSAESLADALTEPKAPEASEMWTAINAEFAKTGTISDESAKLLVASGADPAILVTFNAGLAATQKADMATAADMVGGKEALDTTLAWAKENLSADEKASIIPQLRGAQAETILMGLHARRIAATAPSGQVDTNTLAGGTLPQGNPDLNLKPFRDWSEQQHAMADPRYKTDPDYRAICETRLQLGAGFEIDRR